MQPGIFLGLACITGNRLMTLPPPACPVCLATECRHFLQVGARDYWRCASCEATFLEPSQRPDPDAELAEYQLHRNEVDDAEYRRFLTRLASPLIDRLPPGLSGLDYGCGPGPALADMLAKAGHRMTVFDPVFFNDPATLEASYDFVTCSEVVEHLHYPSEEFARLGRLLKPGGCLAVMTNFQTDDAAFAHWHYRRDPTHVVFYRETTFRTLAHRHDWTCEFPCANVVFLRKP